MGKKITLIAWNVKFNQVCSLLSLSFCQYSYVCVHANIAFHCYITLVRVPAHVHSSVRIYIIMSGVDYYSFKCERLLKLELF